MSADAWSICPRCLARATAEAIEKREAVMALYGTIPVEDFDERRAALPTVDPEAYRTLREDYEFYGAETSEVTADYKCSCTTCGLGGRLKASERFWSPGED